MLNVVGLFFDRNQNNLGSALKDPEIELGWSEIVEQVSKLSTWLINHGLKPKDRVALIGQHQVQTALTFLAVIYSGGVATLINPRFSQERIASALDYVDASMVLGNDEISVAIKQSKSLPATSACPTQHNDPCALIWTSGTTGVPKAAIHTHFSVFYTAMVSANSYQIQAHDRIYNTANLFSSFGMAVFCTSLWAGASNLLDPDLVTHFRVKNNIDRFAPTQFLSIPLIYSQLCMKHMPSLCDVEKFWISGERINAKLIENWQNKTGKKLLNHYGTTEVLGGPLDNYAGTTALGQVMPGWQVRLVDDQGLEVPDNKIGLLQIKSHARAQGYWRDEEQTSVIFKDWITTNDFCTRDPDGFFHFCGRKTDLVKISGEFVNLSLVDKTLSDHIEVSQACCVVRENQHGVDQIEAFVVPWDQHIDPADLTHRLKQHVLVTHKRVECPMVIHVVQELPRTPNGKISRYALPTQN